jgi:hypothetical protein
MDSLRAIKKYSGVVGVLILTAVGVLVVAMGYRSVSFTISFYSSLNPILQILFCVFGCIGSVLIGYSLLFYVSGKWQLGRVYRAIVVLLSAAFLATCIFPNDPDSYTMHDYGSWAMATACLLLTAILLFRLWPRYNTALRVMNVLVLAVMLTVAVTIVANYGYFRSLVLIFEAGFMFSFFIFISLLIFGQPRQE